ncbi:TVP38/TMEM64 family protein [Aurantimonas sp. A2-1-M11]|uniref:TVP38/TMEM64 family protein n=1 Tax=Aurantimonas sp. A2-1-M11 TaxID=3113712 RepID=UPI002F923252
MLPGDRHRHAMLRARGRTPYLIAALIVLAVLGLLASDHQTGWLRALTEQERLNRLIDAAGAFGPAAVVLLLALAIVASPLPSAPIAMVAGAVYGPFGGTVLAVAGSFLGASIAFVIARFLAYDAVRRWDLVRRPLDWLERGHSQTWLMGVVFLTRLAPFLSFDAISYAVGLTPLSYWRFAVATLAGVAPISFLLAYGGGTIYAAGSGSILVTILAFGGITAIPVLARVIWVWLKRLRS